MTTTDRLTEMDQLAADLEALQRSLSAARATTGSEREARVDEALVTVRAMLVRRVETARQQCNDADEIGKNSLARRHRARMWALSDAVREFDEITAGLL